MHVHLTELLERVDADVDQQQHFAGRAGAEQSDLIDSGQRQRYHLLQAAEQIRQLKLAKVAGTWVQ